jgi:hypothetical protein
MNGRITALLTISSYYESLGSLWIIHHNLSRSRGGLHGDHDATIAEPSVPVTQSI